MSNFRVLKSLALFGLMTFAVAAMASDEKPAFNTVEELQQYAQESGATAKQESAAPQVWQVSYGARAQTVAYYYWCGYRPMCNAFGVCAYVYGCWWF